VAPGLAVLLAASDRPEEARALLDEATGLGGDSVVCQNSADRNPK
jgi:Flp pilus assembly protein TadD